MNLSLLSRYKSAFISYSFGKIFLKYPPLFYSIEATNVCNYRCKYCPQSNADEKIKKGQMSTVLFEGILKKITHLKPVAQVYLTGSGEPLIHPNLEEFIFLSNKYGFIPSFSSNGSLFSKERIKSLMESGKFSLTVDFSSNKEIYETYRSGGSWDTVYANLKNLFLYKKKLGRDYPKTEIRDMSTIAISSQEKKGDTFSSLNQVKLKLDTPEGLSQEERGKSLSGLKNVKLKLDTPERLGQKEKEKSLSDLKGLFKDLPVDRFSQLKVHRWIGNIDPKIISSQIKRNKYRVCTHPWSIFVITWNGETLACCRDFRSEYVIGKIESEDGILEIWNNERIKFLREALVSKKPDKINICKNCDRPWTGGSVASTKSQMVKKILWEKIAGAL
jgi:radical SAM protein with 4Fe4S-binding SPASM domain